MIYFYRLQAITGAGHHVYADKSEIFNKYVLEACNLSDSISHLTVSDIRSNIKINEQQISLILANEEVDSKAVQEQELNTPQTRSS